MAGGGEYICVWLTVFIKESEPNNYGLTDYGVANTTITDTI